MGASGAPDGSSNLPRATIRFSIKKRSVNYADALKRYATNRAEILSAVTSVGTFFEGIGVFVKRRLISMDLVDDLFGTMILHTWEKFKPLVKGRREQEETTETLQWFEYLYNEMLKRKQQTTKIG
jgi:hypothetical protein